MDKSPGDFKKDQLQKLGIKFQDWNFMVALAGNPNTGNWPGKTVTRAEGAFVFKEKSFKLVDLPGTYSLLSTSEDEEIARNFILFAQPDVTVIVVDATRLERNLNLTLQILEITQRAVVCLNLTDEARRKGISIDAKKLSDKLGVPVVETVARYEKGFNELLEAIYSVATNQFRGAAPEIGLPNELREPVAEFVRDIEQLYPELPNKQWVALRLLEGDQRIQEAFISGELSGLNRLYNQPALDLKQELEHVNAEEV